MKRLLRLIGPAMLVLALAACDSGTRSDSSTAPATRQPEATATPATAASVAPESAATRGPNPRFYDVTKRLDQGGTFYMYADVKDGLQECVKAFEPMVEEGGPEAKQIFEAANKALEHYGLYGIQDLGLSSLPEANGQYLNKVFISMPGGVKGIPALFGQAPHKIEGLAYAPADTRVFFETDLEFGQVLATVRDLIGRFGGEEATADFDQEIKQSDMRLGINTEQLVGSLGNRLTVIIDQDPQQMLNVPMAGVQFNAPRIALMLTVKNDTLYKTLVQKAQAKGLTGTEQTTQGLTVMPLMAPPNPFYPVAPVIAGNNERLIVATHAALVAQMMRAKSGGLADSAEFKTLSAGLPQEGNGAIFVSKGFFDTLRQVLTNVEDRVKQNGGNAFPLKAQLAKIPTTGTYSIRCHESAGIMIYSRANSGGGQALATVAMVPMAGILAAIAVPNFLEAKSRSQVARVQADMRTMAVAIESYYVDCSAYPAYSANAQNNFFGEYVGNAPELAEVPTFRLKTPPELYILTTPMQYLARMLSDPFAPAKGATYGYYAPPNGWIVWSPGPDGQYDIDSSNVNRIYVPSGQVPSPELIELTFDPTNGTESGGDIYRFKQ